jgi:hypothetical protein
MGHVALIPNNEAAFLKYICFWRTFGDVAGGLWIVGQVQRQLEG